jgi:hypothetical protein
MSSHAGTAQLIYTERYTYIDTLNTYTKPDNTTQDNTITTQHTESAGERKEKDKTS